MSPEKASRKDLVGYRLQRAIETLRDAHLLFEQGGSLWSVINRAYYAMFYAVLALLISVGEGPLSTAAL